MKAGAFQAAAALTCSVALAGVVSAQSASTQQPPRTQPTTPAQETSGLQGMDGKTITLTGCVARDTSAAPSATATTPATGTPSTGTMARAGDGYVLTNVQMRSTAPGGAGTTGTTSTAPGATAGSAIAASTRIKLVSGDAQVQQHVGKQVEVTGRLEVDDDAGTMARPGTAAPETPGTMKPGTTTKPGMPSTPGTTGTTPGHAGTMAGAHGQHMAQLHVTTVRATGQDCKQ